MADPTKLVIISINGGVTPKMCDTFPVVVQAQDDDGNPAPVVDYDVPFTLGAGLLTIYGTPSGVIPVGATEATCNISFRAVLALVNRRIWVADPDFFDYRVRLDVDAQPAADHLTITTVPSQTAGTDFFVTVTRKDSSNDDAKGAELLVTLALLTGTGTLTGTLTGTIPSCASSVLIGPVNYCTVETISIQATADGGLSGDSNTFAVAVGALHHFSWDTISSPQVAGTAFSATIRAKDVCGNTVPSFTGTVALTGTSTPSTTGVFTAGVWTGNITVTIAGSRTVTATGSGVSGTSNSFTVNPAAPDYLLWINPPLDLFCDQQRTLTCKVYDTYDNLCTNDSSTSVTYSAISPQPTVTHTVSAGVTTFLLVVPSCDCAVLSALIEATASGLTGDSFTLNYGFRPCGVLVDCASEKVLVDCASEKILVAPCPKGACCIGPNCSQLTQQECLDLGGYWWGAGTPCSPFRCCATGGPTPPDLKFTWGGTLANCTAGACVGGQAGYPLKITGSIYSALGSTNLGTPLGDCDVTSHFGAPTGTMAWTWFSDSGCTTYYSGSSSPQLYYDLRYYCDNSQGISRQKVQLSAWVGSAMGTEPPNPVHPMLFDCIADVTDGLPVRMYNEGCGRTSSGCDRSVIGVASGGYFDVEIATP